MAIFGDEAVGQKGEGLPTETSSSQEERPVSPPKPVPHPPRLFLLPLLEAAQDQSPLLQMLSSSPDPLNPPSLYAPRPHPWKCPPYFSSPPLIILHSWGQLPPGSRQAQPGQNAPRMPLCHLLQREVLCGVPILGPPYHPPRPCGLLVPQYGMWVPPT